jgi:hypothetical protein
VLDHGLRAGTSRAPITANFRWWADARPLGHRLGVRRRALHLDHAEYFDLCWAVSTAVRVIMARAMSRTLTWPFRRRVPAVTRPARGDGRSAGPAARSPFRSAAAGPKRP